MATFTTKFNLNDILYIMDPVGLNIFSMGVREIFVLSNTISTGAIPYISYRGSLNGITTEIPESNALFLSEAQAQLATLMAQRSANIAAGVTSSGPTFY
jgi:hypothetical protein